MLKQVILVGLVFFTMTAHTLAEISFRLVDIGTSSNSRVFGINNAGTVVGSADVVDGETRLAFKFANGILENLSPNYEINQAHSINNSGDIVGWSRASGVPRATVWQNGIPIDVHQIGERSTARAINDAGEITGDIRIDGHTRTFKYSAGTTTILQNLGGQTSSGFDINSHGEIAGFSVTTDGYWQANLWSTTGTITNLGTLGGEHSEARGLNDVGQVVGYSFNEDAKSEAFMWSEGVMHGLGTLTGTSSGANAINENGSIVGWWSENDFERQAFLYHDGVMHDLQNLVTENFGWTFAEATGINDWEEIIGWGYDQYGMDRAFLLIPIPSPTTALPFATLLHLWFRRKR